jgi:hypothetical protein
MLVVALAAPKFLFRRTRAERALALEGLGRSRRPSTVVRPMDLTHRRIDADPSPVSSLQSVKKALDEIDGALAEMTSSRQVRTPS